MCELLRSNQKCFCELSIHFTRSLVTVFDELRTPSLKQVPDAQSYGSENA